MEPALSILILTLAASTLDVGDCSLYRTAIRMRRDVLTNATSGYPTTFDHVYTIKLPVCRSCTADVSQPRARVFEARDEAPGDKQFEHVLDPTKPVVFTHRINIPPQACGCGDVQALHRRLQVLEKEVANLRKQCSSSRCCGSGSAPDCGAHGTLSPSGCVCVCEEGWRGPNCAESSCPPGCHPPRGECSGGRCVCSSGFAGPDCSQEICPDDCNDQGRCIDGRCVCFPGYTGHGCTEEEKAACPGGCKGHGKCVRGKCICEPGFSGPRCGVKGCPNQCSNRGRCVTGKCVCKDGFTGEDCSVEIPVALHLRMKKILETKATVEWDLPTDNVDAWVITFRPLKEEDGRLISKLGGSRTSFEQTGLASGQEYEVILQAQKDAQLGSAVTRTFTTMIDSPQNLRVVSATNSTLELGWKKPLAAIDHYRLNYSSATGRRSQEMVPAGNSHMVLTGLEAGVEHTISLVGERGQHQSKAAATKGTTVIDSPRDLRTVAVTDSTISLQWERPIAQVDLFRISYTTRSGGAGELTVSGQDRTATLRGLEKGTKYTISLVGEQGKMKSEAVITTATTESLAHRELAGSHSSRPLPANGSQSIQDISKAISRKIAVAGLTADRDAMGHPAVRHHVALGRKPFRSPKVLLTTWPPKPLPTDNERETEGRRNPGAKAQQRSLVGMEKLGSPGRRVIVSPGTKTTPWGKDQHGAPPVPGGVIHPTRSPGAIPTSKGKYGLVGFPGAHPSSRVRAPGIVPTRGKHGSPGSAPSPRRQNEPDLYPSLSTVPGSPLDGQQVSEGAEIPPQSGRLQTTPHGIPQEEQNVEFETSSQISKTWPPPLVSSSRHLIQQSSAEQAGLVVWNATSSCAQLSWEVAGGPFDRLVLAYRDSLTQVVQAKLALGGNQQTANITGLIVGKSYDLYLYGSSSDHPLQPVNVTRISVRGLDTRPVTANKESEDLQTMPAGVQEEGVEEQEEDEDVDEEEIGQEELEGEVTTPSTAGILENTLQPSIENQTAWLSPTPFKDLLVTSQSFSAPSSSDAHGPLTTPNPVVDDNALFQTATDDTLSIPSTASTDRVVNFSDVLAREVKDQSLRLTWKVVGGAFDSFVVRYRQTGSAQWLERQVQGRYRSVLLKGLKAGTEYSLQLYGVREGQRTEPYHLLVTTVSTEKIKTRTVGKLDTFVVSNITDVSFLLTWTTKTQFDFFLIHYGAEGSRDMRKVRVAGELRSSIITGLRPNTKYTLHLYGVSSGLRTKPITTTATTDRSTSRLGTLSIASVTSNSVHLSWTTDRTFDTFLIQYRVQGSQETRNITVTGGKRVYLIRGLHPSTRYTIHLYGISGSLRTQPLTTQVTTTDSEDKDAPSPEILGTLSTPTVTSNSVRLSWTTDRTFDSFLIQYRVQGSQETRNITVAGGKRVYLIGSLRPSTRYIILLYGISGSLQTQPLTTQVTTTDPEDKDAPSPERLGTLSTPTVTSNSVRLSWTTDKTFDSFLIQYRVQGSQETRNITVAGGKRVYLIGSLRPSTRYTILLYGISGSLQTQPLTTQVTTTDPEDKDTPSPERLGTLSTPTITSNSVRLSWTTDRTFDSFLIQYRVQGSQETRNITVAGGKRVYLIGSLRPSTRYTILLYGISGSLQTQPLTTQVTTTDPEDKDTPSPERLGTLSTPTVTSNSVRLSWTTDRTFDSFLIQYRVQGSQETRNITVAGGKRVYLIGSLRPSTRYTILLYGISGSLQTQPLTTQVTTTALKERDQPIKIVKLDSLSSSDVTDVSFQLSWRAEKVFYSFLIVYGVQGSEMMQNLSVSGEQRLVVITGLRPSTTYTVRVYGISAAGLTESLSTLVTTKALKERDQPIKIVKLDSLSSSNVTDVSFQLSWRAEKVFDSFLIVYGVQGSEMMQNLSVSGEQRLVVITGLRPSTTYTVRVYGLSAAGLTESLSTLVTTKAETSQVQPRKAIKLESVSFSNITTSSLRISWRAAKIFDTLFILYGVQGSDVMRNISVTEDQRFTVLTGLRPGTTYTIRVYGVSAGGPTEPVSTVVTTKAPAEKAKAKPKKLGSLTATRVTMDSIGLSWKAERGFEAFLVRYKEHASGTTRNITVSGDQRALSITELQPGTKYTVHIHGLVNGQQTKPLSRLITTPAITDKPTVGLGTLSTPTITSNSVRLSWTTDRTFDSFLIQYRVQGSQETRNITVAGGKRVYLISGLRPSTRYIIHFYGISGSLRTQPLTTQVTTTDPEDTEATAPTELGTLSPPTVTSNSVRLSWTTDRTFDSFLIHYRVQGSQETQNITVTGEKRVYLIKSLRPSTRYIIHLYGISGPVRTQPLTTQVTTEDPEDQEAAAPTKLGTLSPPIVTSNSVRLPWTIDRTFDSFLIQYRVQGSQETRNITVTGEKRVYLIKSLRPSTRYIILLYGISGSVRTQPLTTQVTTEDPEDQEAAAPTKLGTLSPPIVTSNSVRLSWTTDRTFDSFLIQYRVQGSQETQNITVTGEKRVYLIKSLRPSTRYIILLYGISGSVRTQPLTTQVTTEDPEDQEAAAPTKLGTLSPPTVTSNSVRLPWTTDRTFDSFLIQYRVQGSQETQNITVTGEKRVYLIKSLRPSTRYIIHLYGISGSVRTQPLTTQVTTEDPEDQEAAAPMKLGTLSPPIVTSNSVRLPWTTDRTFDSFLIQYRVQGSQETRNITVTGEKRVYLIKSLRPSTRYIIHLYGISGSVRTQPLTTQVTTEDPEDQEAAAPTKLGTLSPPIVTSNSVRLPWTTDRTFDSFLIQYRVQGSQETQNITVTGEKRVYLIRGLRPSTRYIILLYGISGSVRTQPLTTQVTTEDPEDQEAAAPTKLGTLSPPIVTSNSVRLPWTTDRTFDSFLIQYRVQGSQETQNITVTGEKRVYLIKSLRPSTRYIIHLYGISGSVRTQPLTTQVTTEDPEDQEAAAPTKLGTLSPPIVTSNSVRLPWTTDRTFDSFLIQYRVQGSQETQNITVTGEKRVYLIRGLRPSTRYIILLYGISGSVRTQPLTTQVTTEAPEDKAPAAPMKLGTLSPPIVTSNSVRLSWTTDKTFDTFLIQYRVQGSQETRNITVTGGKRVYLIRGLHPSTRYTIHLYGISGSVRTQPLTTQVTTTAPEDKAPVALMKLSTLSPPIVTSNSVHLSWTTDKTFDTFLIQYRVQGSQETRNITVTGGKRVYLIRGLHPSTRYTIHLYGISGSVRTQPLTTQVTTTAREDKDTPSPEILGTLSTPTVTSNSVHLSWTTDRTFDSFLIQYRVQGSQETRNITVAGGKRVYLIGSLRPSTRYTILLYGISGSLQTQPLTTQVTTTDPEDKDAPSPERLGTLSTPTVTSNSVRLSWTTDRTFDSFLIQYRVQGSQETRNITVAGGKRVYLIGSLRPSTRYIILLYGISGSLQTQPLTTQVTTTASEDPTAPVRLGTLSTPTVTSNSVRLSWTTDRTFDSFLIQYRVQGSQETQNITVAGGKRVYLIGSLRPSTRYTILLYGISGSLQTQPLTTQVTTTASEDPTAPVRLGTLSPPTVTTNSVRLSWTTDRTFDSFLIQYRVQGSQETRNITVAGGKRVYLISGLRPSTRYIIRLYGISGSLQTQPLTTQVTTTASALMEGQKPMVVPTLDGVSVSRVTGHSLELSWEAGVSQETGVTRPSEKAELGDLSAVVESASSVHLSWEARKAFDSFVVQYRPEGTEDVQKVSVKGSSRSHTVTGLRPGGKYTFYLYGVSRGRHTKPISATVITKDTPKAASPARPGVSDIMANSLQISWTVKHVYQFFLIQYRAHGSYGFQNLTVAADKSSYSITNLRPSTKYIIYLYGVHEMLLTKLMSFVATTAASIVQEGVRPGQPRALGSLSISNITSDSLELSWSARWRFDSFVIQYRAQGSEQVQRIRVAGNRHSYVILGLQPSTKYTIYVHGVSGGRRTDPLSIVISTTASMDTSGVRPSQLSKLIRLSGNNVTENSLQVHWAAERSFDSFLIQYGAEGSADTQNITAAGDQRSAFIAGLKPATTYRISLIGLSGNRETKPLTTTATTTESRMEEQIKSIMFGSLSFSNITANSLQLSWEMDSTFDSFLIEYVEQGSDMKNNFTVAGDRRSAYITGLKPSTNYTIYLYGVSKGKLSRPLKAHLTITAVPVDNTSVSSLGGVSVSDVTSHGLRLTWTVEEGAFDSFLVRYADTNRRLASKEIMVSGDRRDITLTDLSPGTEYQLSLYGVLDGEETNAIPITALTAQGRQNGMSFTDITDTSVTISWDAASEPVDTYKIFYVPTIQGDPKSRSVDGTRNSITLSGLQPGAQYEVNLVPVRGRVESPPILGHFTTAPDPPSHLQATNVSGTRAVLQWKPATAPIDHYVVSYKADKIPAVRRTVPSNSAELRLVGLRPRTVYTAEIHSVQGVRRSSLVGVSFTTVPVHIPFPKNCEEELSNGRTESNIVTLYLTGNKERPIRVFCDMTTDGGGWIVFQRRVNGKLNFTRSWKDYVAGFGDLAAEHWLGLENLHQLTSQERFELRVDLRAGEESVYASYDDFVVENATVKYKLGLGKYAGTAGNALAYHRGSNFTTVDEDNDNSLTNCAVSYRGGWWYQNCHRVNLNGEYGNNKDHQGVNWFSWKGFEFSIPFAEMKMRPHRADRRE